MEEKEFELENVVLPGQIGFDFGKKRPLNKFIGQIEYYPVSRTFIFMLAVVSSILVNISILFYTFVNLGELPDKVPLVYNYLERIWVQIDKFLLVFVPFIIAAIEFAIIYYSIKVSFIDRRLSTIALLIVAIFNMLILISAVQIFSLVS